MDQAKVLEFMGCARTYDPAPATVERIETHASVVFLAGPFAYKVKRAVKYPFLDFSTLERRRRACLNELRINRRTAPQLYLEVVPVTLETDGTFRLRGKGEVAEWVLVMRRFAQDALYDRMAAEGQLPLDAMAPLAEVIAAFHEGADRVLTQAQALRLNGVIREHEDMLAQNGDVFPPEAAQDFMRRTRETFAALSPVLRGRALHGYVRHCHGDLHLRNIVAIEGRPTLFDAIEFDDSLATIDVLYDLAFLLMDLGKRGLKAHANAALNAYLDATGDTGNLLGLAALPLFLSLRAVIRAKVALLRARAAVGGHSSAERGNSSAIADEVRAYFALARSLVAPTRVRLVAIGGLSGSGKSAVSQAIAPEIGSFPGAIHIRSDVERKRLFGVSPEARLPAHAYAAEVSDVVYGMCRKRAALVLAAGHSVIVDAVHARPHERDAVAALAAAHGADFSGLWLDVPAEVMLSRVARREGDVSDAGPEVVEAQLAYALGEIDFARIDGSLPLDDVGAICLARIAGQD